MAAKKDRRIVSAGFMSSLIDFTGAGELEVFIDESQVQALEKKMNERGYLEGSEMANSFNMLRSNDLIWSFVINNYLLGRDPFPFDLLHWNCDSTRMPAKMHSFYLRNMYLRNALKDPGGHQLADVPIDVSKITLPTYFVSAIEDHIAPWKTTYAGPQLLGGKSRFVLSGSGHIAGMINPPSANKYGYWTNDKLAGDTRRMAGRREAARRFLVERLAGLAQAAAGAAGRRARARKERRKGPPEDHRARARKLRAIASRCSLNRAAASRRSLWYCDSARTNRRSVR